MNFNQTRDFLSRYSWELKRVEGEFFGYKYIARHKNGRNIFRKYLSEFLYIDIEHTYPSCELYSDIPRPIKYESTGETKKKL
jgi:hypothetical protein